MVDHSPSDPSDSQGDSRHEQSDVHSGLIALTGGLLLVGIVVAGVVVAGTRSCLVGPQPGPKVKTRFDRVERHEANQPGVEIHPGDLRKRVVVSNTSRIHQYRWDDDRHTHAHVPIDRAMDMVLDTGLPTRPHPQSQ